MHGFRPKSWGARVLLMRKRGVAFFLLLAVAAAGLVWSLRVVFPSSVVEVEAVRVRRGTLEVTLPVAGAFEARTVDLSFDAPGRLETVDVHEGQTVVAGALLATVNAQEARAGTDQAAEAVRAAERESERAAAAVDAATRQAQQAQFALRTARATLAQLRAAPQPGELRQADAAVDAARSAVEEARRTLERTEQLVREGAMSQAQLDAARAQLVAAEARHRQAVAQRDLLRAGARPEVVTVAEEQVGQAQAAWEAARANVRQAEATASAARARVAQAGAALRAAEARLSRAGLRAPFAGIVTRVFFNSGSPVAPSIPVVSLAAPGGWVTAEVDEADIGRVRVGQTARVTADAYPGRTFSGRVTAVGRQVDIRLGTRVVRVRIDLDTPAGMRVGTSVDVEVIVRTIPEAILAPVEGVIAAANGAPHVFVVEDNVLRRREVRAGPGNDEFITITAGLREGELLGIAEGAKLRDGMRVRVVSVR